MATTSPRPSTAERGAHGESLLEVPSWATLAAHEGPLVGTRLLDVRAGVLWREVRGEDGSTLRSARWACLARPGTNVLVALGTSEVLEVKTGSELVELHTSTGGGVTAIVETVRDDGRGRPEGHDTHLARVSTFATSSRRSPSKKVAAAAHRRAAGRRRMRYSSMVRAAAGWVAASTGMTNMSASQKTWPA